MLDLHWTDLMSLPRNAAALGSTCGVIPEDPFQTPVKQQDMAML